MRHDNRVGSNHQCQLASSQVVDFGGVDRDRLLGRGLKDVFEGGERFRERLGDGGRDDFELIETDLEYEKFRIRDWSVISLLKPSPTKGCEAELCHLHQPQR